jgi:glutathione S-transferase
MTQAPQTADAAIKVYGMAMSGNCWKASQILRLTGHAFVWIETDPNIGDTQTEAFRALNPQGEVPVVVLADGTVLTQSNAILAHFAEGTRWLPPAGLQRTRALQWMFWEQYSHEPYIAVARNLITYRGQREAQAERLRVCAERGHKALAVMEQTLSGSDWLCGKVPSIADLALFAYTHVADEGEFDLARTPGVQRWVQRVAGLPGIVPLPRPQNA